MTTHSTRSPRGARPAMALLLAGTLAAAILGCHSGTPAAPEGTEIELSAFYISQDFASGDFEAIIEAIVKDELSDVPQAGVGVFFVVDMGPGCFVARQGQDPGIECETVLGPVRTTGGGRAQAVLIGDGATGQTADDDVEIRVTSGGAMDATLTLDVRSGSAGDDVPPTACFTTDVFEENVEVDVGCSRDPDCPDDEPDEYSVDWGDGESDRDLPFSQQTIDHDYDRDGTYTITLTVTDCTGLTATTTRDVDVDVP